MRRLPVLATLIVLAAVMTMIGLGIWQLQRKAEKEALVARYALARDLPPVRLPDIATVTPDLLYRRAIGRCLRVTDRRSEGGRDANGRSGWVQLAGCNGSNVRPGFQVVLGWTDQPTLVTEFNDPRNDLAGIIARGRGGIPRLVLTEPISGLAPAQLPSPKDVPNNHLFYAIQWFFFAAGAAVIYVLALQRRSR